MSTSSSVRIEMRTSRCIVPSAERYSQSPEGPKMVPLMRSPVTVPLSTDAIIRLPAGPPLMRVAFDRSASIAMVNRCRTGREVSDIGCSLLVEIRGLS